MTNAKEARILVPLLAGCGAAVAAAAAILFWGRALDAAVSWALALGVIAAALLPLLRDSRRGKFDLFNLRNAFLGYYVLQFGVWGLWILATGDTEFLGNLERWEEPFQLALFYALVGVLAFHLGCASGWGERLAAHLPSFPSEWVLSRIWILALILLPLALWSFSVIIQGRGGLSDWLGELGTSRAEGIREKGYYLLLAWVGPATLLLTTYAAALETRGKRYLLLLPFLFLMVLGVGFVLGYRAFVVFPLLQVFCLHHYLKARIRLRPRYLLVVAALAVLINIYSVYREVPLQQLRSREVFAELQQGEFWRESSVRFLHRFYGVESFTLVVDRTETFLYGVPSATTLLTFPIPRSLWPEKIAPLPVTYARTFLYDFGSPVGAAPTLLGELYWNFGPAGILAGLFLVGVFCKTLYSYLRRRQDKSTVLLYSVALVYVIWMVEAPTIHTVGFLAMTALTGVALATLTFAPRRGRP